MSKQFQLCPDHGHKLIVAWALYKNIEGCEFPYSRAWFTSELERFLGAQADSKVVTLAWNAVMATIGSRAKRITMANLNRLVGPFQVRSWTVHDLYEIISSASEFLANAEDARELLSIDGESCSFQLTTTAFDGLVIEVGTELSRKEDDYRGPAVHFSIAELLLGDDLDGAVDDRE